MNSANLPLIEGFFFSAGLIVGIGPRNTLILRQGLRRQHLLLIVLLCTLVDAGLITLGTVGVGALIQNEWLIKLMTLRRCCITEPARSGRRSHRCTQQKKP
jgi:L-lysine exporter family protein LysE/ArgO